MLEVYHFVTPLSADSIISEKKVITYIKQTSQLVSYRMIPVVTMQSVRDTYQELKMHKSLNVDYAIVAQNLSQLALDTKAVQSQGKKAARLFYDKMQELLLANVPYSKSLVLSTLSKLHLDTNLFLEDYNTSATISALKADQNMAATMDITNYPTMIVCDSNKDKYAFKTSDFSTNGLSLIFNPVHQSNNNSSAPHLINYEEGSN